jgi:predicted Rossmann fold flavoprotein
VFSRVAVRQVAPSTERQLSGSVRITNRDDRDASNDDFRGSRGAAVSAASADLVVVGAGAAGLMSAIVAGRHGADVIALEGAVKLGAKILISGGGRCNVTNARVAAADFNGGARRSIDRVLKAFPVDRTVAFFAELGVALHEEPRGKLFPDTERAATVLDALIRAARDAGVRIFTGQRVEGVARDPCGFAVRSGDRTWTARRVILATGGLSVPKTGSDGHGLSIAAQLGHTIVETTPALVPLVLDRGEAAPRLAGVGQDVVIELIVDGRVAVRVPGPMLWTHQGISGPAALDVSRHWHRARLAEAPVRVQVNLCGGRSFEDVDRTLASAARGRTSIRTALEAWMPSSVASEVLESAGIDPSNPLSQLTRDARRQVVRLATALPLAVAGSRGYTHAEATAGGVSLDEIDPGTMGSRICPDLYIVGEMLDVDGRLGGFNFQWAWSSGYVAGRAAARA